MSQLSRKLENGDVVILSEGFRIANMVAASLALGTTLVGGFDTALARGPWNMPEIQS